MALLVLCAVILLAIGCKVLRRWHEQGGNGELAAGVFAIFLGAVLALVGVLYVIR